MATVTLRFPTDSYDVPVDLDTTTPFDLMVYAVYALGKKPAIGSIWKMRKAAAHLNHCDPLSSPTNGIIDGDVIDFDLV